MARHIGGQSLLYPALLIEKAQHKSKVCTIALYCCNMLLVGINVSASQNNSTRYPPPMLATCNQKQMYQAVHIVPIAARCRLARLEPKYYSNCGSDSMQDRYAIWYKPTQYEYKQPISDQLNFSHWTCGNLLLILSCRAWWL